MTCCGAWNKPSLPGEMQQLTIISTIRVASAKIDLTVKFALGACYYVVRVVPAPHSRGSIMLLILDNDDGGGWAGYEQKLVAKKIRKGLLKGKPLSSDKQGLVAGSSRRQRVHTNPEVFSSM